MPTWIVRVPKSQEPKFPPLCAECGADPTTTVRIQEDAIGWWSVMRLSWLYGAATGRSVEVPACDACAPLLRRQRWKNQALLWVFAILGIVVGLWLFSEWTGLAKRAAMIGIVLVAAIPYAIWSELFPPAVDITVTDNTVWFHFADREYADKFATENGVIS